MIVLVSFFASFAMEPLVNRMERMGIRRGLGTGITFLVLLASLGLFLWAIGAVLADQIGDLVDDAPGYIRDIEDWVEGTFDIEVNAQGLLVEFQEGGAATNLAARLGRQLGPLGCHRLASAVPKS